MKNISEYIRRALFFAIIDATKEEDKPYKSRARQPQHVAEVRVAAKSAR